MRIRLKLPNRSLLPDTTHGNDEDPLKFYYKFPYSYIYKKRLSMCLDLIDRKYKKVLEVGYGGTVYFMSDKKSKITHFFSASFFENGWCKGLRLQNS